MSKSNKGFTLVELLIVIGLLGAIALIVIAAINPIEQANRARDTRFKADGGQLTAAIERYYTTRNAYPWVTSGGAANNDAVYGFATASTQHVGVCGATCAADGELLTTFELKPEFRGRDFITNGGGTDNTKKIYVGKATTATAPIYACYIPLSKSNRDKACTDGKVYTISATTGARSSVTCTSSSTWVLTPAGSEWMVCIPE